jgi:hypothetical protein
MILFLGLFVCSFIAQARAFSPSPNVALSFRHHPRPACAAPTPTNTATASACSSRLRVVLSALDDSADNSGEQREQNRLLSLLGFIQNREERRVPCGFDAMEKEQELVAQVIAQVEQDATHNLVSIQNGKIEAKDLFGDWNLLYTSSRTMILNQSLSGLGRSSSDKAGFASLVQKLSGNK